MLSRIPPWGTLKSQEMRWRKCYKTRELLKVVVFLLGKTKSFVWSESRTNLWEYQVCILHTLKDKMYHLYHVLRSRTLRSNVFTPCSRGVHSAVSFGLGTLGGWFACPRVMGSSWFSVFEVISQIRSLRGHVTVGGYGFWKITSKTGGLWVYNLKEVGGTL